MNPFLSRRFPLPRTLKAALHAPIPQCFVQGFVMVITKVIKSSKEVAPYVHVAIVFDLAPSANVKTTYTLFARLRKHNFALSTSKP